MVMKYYRAYLAKEADVYIKDDTFWGENFIKQPMSVDRPVVYTLEKQNLTQDFIYPGDAFLVSTRLFAPAITYR